VNFAEKLQKNKIFLGAVIFLLCLGLVFAVQSVTNAGADPANNGNELGTLAPAETGFIIGGEGITRGLGFQQNFYYLSKAELKIPLMAIPNSSAACSTNGRPLSSKRRANPHPPRNTA
jgi:hypothetical protein